MKLIVFVFSSNCDVLFNGNKAADGGAVHLIKNSHMVFEGNSVVVITNNSATDGGGISINKNSQIYFKRNSTAIFTNNFAKNIGGAIVCYIESDVIISGDSKLTFSNNVARDAGGAACFIRNATLIFIYNEVKQNGGAISFSTSSVVIITENCSATFNGNRAEIGGAVYFSNESNITFSNYSITTFSNNIAILGGSPSVDSNENATFEGNSVIQFNVNRASNGGAIALHNITVVKFQEHTKVTFKDNRATVAGGAIHSTSTSNVFFTRGSMVLFYNNSAKFGGNIYTKDNSSVTITANSTVKFNDNTAKWYSGFPYSNQYGYTDIAVNSNGTVNCSDQQTLLICIHESCFCEIIDSVLANLTSNTQIDLSVNVTLSSIINLAELNNISLIGYHNPTTKCRKAGGVNFTNCHNCMIEGITWHGCGAKHINSSSVPAIKFYHSTNITVQNCTFQHSVAQAVVLSDVSGNMQINQCKFLHNNLYEGHGTAIYFSSTNSKRKNTLLLFSISHYNFSKNKESQSIIFISQGNNDKSQILFLNNSSFICNQGTMLYLLNQNLHVVGNVTF